MIGLLVAAVAAAAALGSAVGSILVGRWQRASAHQALEQQRLDHDAAGRQHHLDQVLARYQAALTGLGSGNAVARELALQELRAISTDPASGSYAADAASVLGSELVETIGHVSGLVADGQLVEVVMEDDEQ